MQYDPTLPEGRGISPWAFPSPKRMGLKNVPPNLQPTRIGKSDPWAFPSLAGRIRGRMQYAPTLPEGRGISPLAFPSSKRLGFKNVPANPQPTRIGKSDPWAFSPLAGRTRGRMQYAPTHSTGRKIAPSAFSSPKRMGFKNVPPNLQPTRIGKSDPLAFLSLAGRIMGRMQYAPTHSAGRKIDPLAFPPLAGRARGRMQYAPTHSAGRKIAPSAFSSPKRMEFENVPPNPQPTRIGKSDPWPFPSLAGRIMGRMQYAPTNSAGRKSDPWAFSLLAGRARGGYFCDLSLLIFSDHYPQTYFSFLVFETCEPTSLHRQALSVG